MKKHFLFIFLSLFFYGGVTSANTLDLPGIWWMPTEKIVVQCKHDKQAFPWIDEIVIKGTEVQFFLENQARILTGKVTQTSWSKRWTHPEFELNVGLKANKGSDYHVGTLLLKGSKEEYIGLWCFPKM